MDMRFKSPFSLMCAGASKSGKSSLVFKLIKHRDKLFTNPEQQGNTYVFYTEYQPLFQEYNEYVREFVQGPCTMKWLRENCDSNGKTITVVLDDLAQDSEAMAEASTIFSVGSHHLNVNVIFLTQNLFSKNKHQRDLSLNASYMILFRNPRDKSQIFNFAKQFMPSRPRTVREIYELATKLPFSYLLFDMNQITEERYRLISHLFSEDGFPPRVYAINNA